MTRTYHLRGESKQYDFRLDVDPAQRRKGIDVVGSQGDLTVFYKGTNQVAHYLRIASLAARASDADYKPSILAEDFDFDGHEDFAIDTGDFGPYGAPTYSVFVFAPALRAFTHSPALSSLTERSVGPMRADAARKRLVIASKSGCCVHWFEEYELHHGVPQLMKRETEEDDLNGKCVLTVEIRLRNGGMSQEKRSCR